MNICDIVQTVKSDIASAHLVEKPNLLLNLISKKYQDISPKVLQEGKTNLFDKKDHQLILSKLR